MKRDSCRMSQKYMKFCHHAHRKLGNNIVPDAFSAAS